MHVLLHPTERVKKKLFKGPLNLSLTSVFLTHPVKIWKAMSIDSKACYPVSESLKWLFEIEALVPFVIIPWLLQVFAIGHQKIHGEN